MKTKSEFIVSATIAILFLWVTTASNNGNDSSSLNKKLASEIQKKAEIGYNIVQAELGYMKELLLVEQNRLIFRNLKNEVLTIYKDETGLAVLKESTGIANVLPLQLEELTFSYSPTSEQIEVVFKTGRSITHSSGVKTQYSGTASGSMSVTD